MCTPVVGTDSKDRDAIVGITETIRAPGVKGVRGGRWVQWCICER